jgi:hypothetical protein
MALKFIIDTLDGLPPAVREHYTAKDGKYHLTLIGDHPDTVRVAEFRDNNVALKKENDDLKTKFAGFDPDVVKAERAELETIRKEKPNETIAALRAQLADAQGKANASTLKDAITAAFLKAGGRANAVDYIVTKASDKFTVENGALVGKVFDPSRPGEKLTVDAFMSQQVRESDFAFLPSGGGGANPLSGGGRPSTSAAKELRNPTPQQLGANASAIARGELRVVHDNE